MPSLPAIPSRWQKLVNLLQLVRLPLAFTAVSNSWVMLFLAGSIEPPERQPRDTFTSGWALAAALGLLAVVSGGLHAYGMALNDILDARHDRLFSPQRPIPAGGVGTTAAVVLAVLCLLGAVLAAVLLPDPSPVQPVLTVGAAVAILFFNGTGKFLPAVGILALGLIRALNMLIPAPQSGFLWPLWLSSTHVMLCWSIAYYLESKRPRLHAAQWWFLCGGWTFWTLLLVSWMRARHGLRAFEHPTLWYGPLAAVAVFVVLAWWTVRDRRSPRARRAAGAAFVRLAMLWLIVYDASWLLGAHLWWQAGVHLALLVGALASMRLLGALDQLSGPAPTYRLTVER
jgi:4-hydroxybenzoate polyprenyltransferase